MCVEWWADNEYNLNYCRRSCNVHINTYHLQKVHFNIDRQKQKSSDDYYLVIKTDAFGLLTSLFEFLICLNYPGSLFHIFIHGNFSKS